MERVSVTSHLPQLLKLVDDPSPVVSEEVGRALMAIPDLQSELERLEPSPDQRRHLQRLLRQQGYFRRQLLANWSQWQQLSQPLDRLEALFALVSDFQSEFRYSVGVSQLLDAIAAQSRAGDPRELSRYLFEERLGGDRKDYYHPRNSDLVDVWYRGRGIPMSLSAIFILTGHRLRFRVSPCNFPGHFLARVEHQGATYFVDCFDGGRWLTEELSPRLRGRVPPHLLPKVLRKDPPIQAVISRLFRNLVNAYQEVEKADTANFFRFLLKVVEAGGRMRPEPEFAPGDLVVDSVGGYRGVVVDYDLSFEKEEDQEGAKALPWYRVLIDGSSLVSYASQRQLESDPSEREVRHPFVNYFFRTFEDGNYRRNNLPWPD